MRELVGALVLLGCGGSPEPLPPATHADFRAIQREEAALATAQTAVREAGEDCARACDAARAARTAAARLCEVARRVDDGDARARCKRARASGRESVGTVRQRCRCP